MSSPGKEPLFDIEIPDDLPEDEDMADMWDEERIDIIGPNGNNGEHYEQTNNGDTRHSN